MARNASGTYSLPSAVNPVQTRTTITSNWANTTLADIATEITDSLSRSGKGAMTQPLQINAGTVSAPGLTFDGDTNLGLYRVGADQLGFACAGSNVATLTGSSLTIASALQVLAASGTQGAPGYSFSADTNIGLYRGGADDLRVAINSVDVATFTTKLSIAAATAATGGTRQDALSLTNGDLDLSAVTAPDSTTSVANRLTPTNIIKAWALVSMTNATPFVPSVTVGFNVASVARNSANSLTVSWAQDFASANYVACCLNMAGNARVWTINNGGADRLAGSAIFVQQDTAAGAATNIDGVGATVMVLALGAQ